MNTVLFSTAKLTWGGILLFLDMTIFAPSFNLVWVVLGAITLDFITGVSKAVFNKEERTSKGYRKTIIKASQYAIPILVIWALSWLAKDKAPEYVDELQHISGFLMYFIIYIEVTSIFENLYDIDKKSVIAKYLYRPALKILKFGIEHNPLIDAAKKIDDKKEEPKS